MQIKFIKSLLILLLVMMPIVSNAALSEWFAENCKQVKDQDGLTIRIKDIKQTPDLKNAKFYTGLCSNKTAPSGQSYCVKLFKDSQVQNMAQAIQIAKDYALEINRDIVTCHNDYWSCKDNDDHILCSTADNSAHYEFVFDDITEKSDAKYKEGIAKSYCKIVFGEDTYIENSGKAWEANDELVCWKNRKEWQEHNVPNGHYHGSKSECESVQSKADKLNNLLNKTYGYTVRNNCNNWPISFETKYCNQDDPQIAGKIVTGLRTYKNIDNRVFKLQQINLSADIVGWLGQYVQRFMGDEPLETFRCDLAAKTCKTGESSLKNPHDDYLTCYINDHPIDFQFDDLSESWESYQKGSKQAIECINSDGVFDGRKCHGIKKEDCISKNFGGTEVKWNDNLQACTLKDANKVANINRSAEIASTVVVAGAITAATVITGGGTVMVLLSVGGVAAATGSQVVISAERESITKFTSEILACKNRDCIRKQFIWFLDHGSNYINNLTNEQINAIDEAISRKLILLDMTDDDDKALKDAFDNSQDKGIVQQCTGDALQASKCVFDAAAIVFDFLPVTKTVLKAPAALSVFSVKIGNKLPRVSQALLKLRTTSNTVRRGLKVTDKMDMINDINTAVSGAGLM